ncbi:MAG: tetratricopeptide repeat protein [Blastomonas sp.]
MAGRFHLMEGKFPVLDLCPQWLTRMRRRWLALFAMIGAAGLLTASLLPASALAQQEMSDDEVTALANEIVRLRDEDATAYAEGDFARAAAASAKVVVLTEQFNPEGPDFAQALNDHALNLHFMGNGAEAEPLLARALPLHIALYGENGYETIKVHNNYGVVLTGLGRFAEAETHYRRSFEAARDTLGPDDTQTRDAAANLSLILYNLGQIADAAAVQRYLTEAMAINPGPDDPATLRERMGLGSMLYEIGKYDESQAILADTVERQERVLGADNPETISTLSNLSVAYEKAGMREEAEPAAREALARARRTYPAGHPEIDFALTGLINVLVGRAQYAEALELATPAYQEAAALLGPESEGALGLANAMANIYAGLGRYNDGLEISRRSAALIEEHYGPYHPFRKQVRSIESALLNGAGRYSEAEPLSREALDDYLQRAGPDSPDTLLLASNHALLLMNLGKLAEAEAMYSDILPRLGRVLGNRHPVTLTAGANLGLVLINQGRFAEAEQQLLAVQADCQAELGRKHPLWLQTASNLALVLIRQQRFAEARHVYEDLIESWTANYGIGNPGLLQSKGNLAYLLQQSGDLDGAAAAFREVAELSSEHLGPNQIQTLTARANLALTLLQIGEYEEAAKIMTALLETPESDLPAAHPVRLATTNNLSLIFRLAERYEDADNLLQLAVAAQLPVYGLNHPDMIETLANQVFVRLSEPVLSQRALEPARLLVEAMDRRVAEAGADLGEQAQSARDRDRLGFYYPRAADALWLSYDTGGDTDDALRAEGFAVLQKAVVGGANDAIAKMAVRSLADSAGEGLGALVRERETLADQWTENARQYNEALTSEAPGAEELRTNLRTARDRITARIAEIDNRLSRDFPQFFALTRPASINPDEASQILADDEAALMIVPSEFGTHVVAITRNGLVWHRSGWDVERINALVKRLLWDVGASVEVNDVEAVEWASEGEGAYPFDRRSAYALYAQLIAPVESALAGKSHVFIAAGGSLSSLPFGLLVTEPPEGADGDPDVLRATKWFADAHALIQIPSLQSLQFLRSYARAPASGPGDSFTGFGDPVLEGKAETRGASAGPGLSGEAARAARRGHASGLAAADAFAIGTTRSGGGVVDISALKRMARLPGTARELEAMRSALGAPASSIHTGSEATEAAVRSADLSNTRILALATHGLMAGEVRGAAEPGLVFTPPETPGEADDGLLTASEVAALRLNADWVILSACNTAAGDGSQGAPGLSGLARAFFYAGARNLLASHWPVRDDVAARITVRTLEIARDDPALSRAQAFTLAMREIRMDPAQDSPFDTLAHPNAWAPFTLIGDGAK